MSAPNNFPQEGQNGLVTSEMLAQLYARRNELIGYQTHTLEGYAEGRIKAADNAARNYQYTIGHRILAEARENLLQEANRVWKPQTLDIQALRSEAEARLSREFWAQSQAQRP